MKTRFPGRLSTLLLFITLTGEGPLHSAEAPPADTVTAAMQKAVDFYHGRLASHGGYASAWKKDLSEAQVEGKRSKSVISIQPPGIPTVGLAMLNAYEATGDAAILKAAQEAGGALIACQMASGGWTSDFDFDQGDPEKFHLRSQVLKGDTEPGKRKFVSTLDDNKTQSALLFLLELADAPESKTDPALQGALEFGLDSLIGAQAVVGAWPQQFDGPAPADGRVLEATLPENWPREWPDEKYHRFHTLNDGNLLRIAEVLLRANDLTGDARYLDSARKLGDFLLLAQLPEPQAAWAQQYNEEMRPVWARKFEPPGISSIESYGAVETLFKIWLATGDDNYRATVPVALAWLEKSRLPDGQWARFYELGTNRPLYCEAETYKITYDDSNLPTHYGFKIEPDFIEKIERMREDLNRPREELLKSRAEPDSPERWAKSARSLIGKVNTALKEQTSEGYWLDDDLIDAGLFVKHMNAMALYVKGVKNAGGKI